MQDDTLEQIKKWKLEIKEHEEKLPTLNDSIEISKTIGRIGTFKHFIRLEKMRLKELDSVLD
ncbi:MAG: hypothetical protein ACE5J9_07205 [Methanosarcinales archaeon]